MKSGLEKILRAGKKIVLAGAATLALAAAGCNVQKSYSLEAQYWNLGDAYAYQHTTHPDDFFLSGSPGTTRVKNVFMFGMGAEFSGELSHTEPYARISVLAAFGRDEHKNDNDPRPIGSHSAVYSQAFPVAPQISAGARIYPLKDKFYIAPELSATLISMESGWNRFDEDEHANRASKVFVNGGIKLGYKKKSLKWEIGFLKGVGNDSFCIPFIFEKEF